MSGRGWQAARVVYPVWEFTLTYGENSWLRDQTQNITAYAPLAGQTEFETLSALFLLCQGAYGEFYYADPDDSSRAGAFVATANGGTTYTLMVPWGSGPFTPGFSGPVGGIKSIENVYINGAAVSPLNYTIDATNTAIVFTALPPPPTGSIITADFHFYFRCSFSADTMEFSEWAMNLWEAREVKFKSVKP